MPDSPLFATVRRVFREEGWASSEIPDREVLRAGFEAHHARVDLHVQAFPELPGVSVVAESTLSTDDPARRDRLAELAMRINRGLTVGNFEMDWEAGRLLFRASNVFSTPEGDIGIIKGLVHNTVGEMDRAAPVEALLHRSPLEQLPGIEIAELLEREDLLPEVPAIPEANTEAEGTA